MDKEDATSTTDDEIEEESYRTDTPGPLPEHQYSRVSTLISVGHNEFQMFF